MAATLALLAVVIVSTFFIVTEPPKLSETPANVVNDVTQLNPVAVSKTVRPTSTEQICRIVRAADVVSIGGARHSMGGQIATEQSVHLDMRDFDEIISFDKDGKEIIVQTGITWRKIQEYIDPHDLSVSIMQTYANFTVGGSLSVNVHGRYIGHGPIIHSVKSIRVVLSDGSEVEASPGHNPELFYGCIGGYGGLGVITEATLRLEDNCKVARESRTMKIDRYAEYFKHNIQNDTTVIFHNADIYPDQFDDVRAVSFVETAADVTIPARLTEIGGNYRLERFGIWIVTELPGGKWIRQHLADPLYYRRPVVKWRNHEASFDANELEPTSREHATFVLQEYFVPVGNFDEFVPRMTAIFQKHDVNVLNISIRHVKADPGSLLGWARNEMFCFVIYYEQGTSPDDRRKVGIWTRELIDEAIAADGSYYLPYQLHATDEQFLKAYPRSPEYFVLKTKLDPSNKFRNKLWDKYYNPERYSGEVAAN